MSIAEQNKLFGDIERGLALSRQRLVERTKKNGGELVVMQNGKIVHVKAEDL
ncbi:MAG: hypothetical protein MJ003_00435 [Paludibacteraceae bacterium]|nr:hypothetical protein [Paludibacteraceae bacterium]